tara:strand:- start:652 stop:1035 length:384 start_codon:yes stop_codon:yes gene_type:complete
MEQEKVFYSFLCPMCAYGENLNKQNKNISCLSGGITYSLYSVLGCLVGDLIFGNIYGSCCVSQLCTGMYKVDSSIKIREKYNLDMTICEMAMPFICTPISIIQDRNIINSVVLDEIDIEPEPYEIKG